MIVRIATDGQYRLSEEDSARLNELDNEAVAAVDRNDEDRFHELFEQMLALARSGQPLGDDELLESDVILPPPDITFVEAGAEFTGEGLIPG